MAKMKRIISCVTSSLKQRWKAEQKARHGLCFKARELQQPAVDVILQEKPNEKDES